MTSYYHALTLVIVITIGSLVAPGYAHTGCHAKSHPLKELQEAQKQIETLKRQRTSLGCKQCIKIDTYVTVFQSTAANSIEVNQAKINEQMEIINKAFENTAFSFELKAADFIVDNAFYNNWFSTPAEIASEDPVSLIAKYPRRGDYSTLNMYYGGKDTPFSFALFPAQGGVAKNPLDGVYNGIDVLPDDDDDEEYGLTAVHEVSPSIQPQYVVPLINPSKLLTHNSLVTDWSLARFRAYL